MVNYAKQLEELEQTITEKVPGFKIKFKDESLFMKILGKIMFFNKSFMTRYTTTLGKTVYFPSRADYERDPRRFFGVLAHEYVHVMDYVRHPILFVLGYATPQILALLALFSFFAFLNPFFLLFLLALIFLAPIPAPYRTWAELRGYGMSIKVRIWDGQQVSKKTLERYADAFTTSAYYFMCPFRSCILKKLAKWADPTNSDWLSDTNPAFEDVHRIVLGS